MIIARTNTIILLLLLIKQNQGTTRDNKITGEIQQVPVESDARISEIKKAMIKVDIPVQPEQAELSYAEIKEKSYKEQYAIYQIMRILFTPL